MFNWKINYKWPFSIAFCMFTRPGMLGNSCVLAPVLATVGNLTEKKVMFPESVGTGKKWVPLYLGPPEKWFICANKNHGVQPKQKPKSSYNQSLDSQPPVSPAGVKSVELKPDQVISH